MGRLGIFGGTFDPIHLGHLRIALEAREQFSLEKVIFVPNKIPPHKGMPFFTEQDRVFFLERVISPFPYFTISLVELETEDSQKSYTYFTLQKMKKVYENKELYFIIGEDSYWEIESWYRWKDLLKLTTFLVYPRIRKSQELREIFQKDNRGNFLVLDAPKMEISSTLIREKLKKGLMIEGLVPDAITDEVKKRFYKN